MSHTSSGQDPEKGALSLSLCDMSITYHKHKINYCIKEQESASFAPDPELSIGITQLVTLIIHLVTRVRPQGNTSLHILSYVYESKGNCTQMP